MVVVVVVGGYLADVSFEWFWLKRYYFFNG